MISRRSGPLALCMLLACGPALPDDGGPASTGTGAGASTDATTTGAPTTDASTSGCDDVNTTGWTRSELDGDIWISLCADTCAQFMSGAIVTLEAWVSCEAA
jgi:hypothetical protein